MRIGIFILLYLAVGPGRTVQSVLPSLTYSRTCSTVIEVKNLGNREAEATLEPHRESGSLVSLTEQPGMAIHLEPGDQKQYTLRIPEATDNAWVAVREIVPSLELSPVLSVSGMTSCTNGNHVRNAVREVAHASVDPYFDRDIGRFKDAVLTVVNTADSPAKVIGCYSGGTWVSNPNVPGGSYLRPLCTHEFQEEIAPMSARQFPVDHGGNSHFTLRVKGRSAALQLLRLLDAGSQLYQVDSAIRFGN